MVRHTKKILRCEHCKILKVYSVILEYYAWHGKSRPIQVMIFTILHCKGSIYNYTLNIYVHLKTSSFVSLRRCCQCIIWLRMSTKMRDWWVSFRVCPADFIYNFFPDNGCIWFLSRAITHRPWQLSWHSFQKYSTW